MTGEVTPNNDLLNRLSRIEGQVRGTAKIVEQDKYCSDVLTQVSAVSQAMQSVALRPLEGHLSHCVLDAARAGGPQQEAKLQEASDAIARSSAADEDTSNRLPS